MFLDRAHGTSADITTHIRGTATRPRTGQRRLDDAGGLMLMQTEAVILFLFSHTRLTFSFQWPLLLCPGEGRAEAAYERVRSQRCGALRRAREAAGTCWCEPAAMHRKNEFILLLKLRLKVREKCLHVKKEENRGERACSRPRQHLCSARDAFNAYDGLRWRRTVDSLHSRARPVPDAT